MSCFRVSVGFAALVTLSNAPALGHARGDLEAVVSADRRHVVFEHADSVGLEESELHIGDVHFHDPTPADLEAIDPMVLALREEIFQLERALQQVRRTDGATALAVELERQLEPLRRDLAEHEQHAREIFAVVGVHSCAAGQHGLPLASPDVRCEPSGEPLAGVLACPLRPLSVVAHPVTESADGARSVAATDLDGDGDTDLVLAAANADTVSWFESDGAVPPAFTEHLIASPDGPQSVQTADVDGDGDVDVVSANGVDDAVAWYESDGAMPPSFTTRTVGTGLDNVKAIVVIDVDGDGDLDVVAGAANSGTVTWHENDGAMPPVFTAHVITASAPTLNTVTAGDADGDGDVDVIAGFGNNIQWYANDGAMPPTFGPGVEIDAAAAFVQWVSLADLDLDGDLDLLSAGLTNNTIAWHENDGMVPPTFTKTTVSAAANRPSFVTAQDLDGDLFPDIVAASGNGDFIAWYKNDGMTPPTFAPFTVTTAVNFPQGLDIADVDGDGQLDIASASLADDQLAWFQLTEPQYGFCCLPDGTCLDGVCLAECASLLAWAWTPDVSCGDVACPGSDAPALVLVDQLDYDNFKANIQHLAAYGTRYWDRQGNEDAVQWLAEQLESFGYDNVTLDPYTYQDTTKHNIYATKIGTERPGEMYIVGAHMDTFNSTGQFDDAPGADDDGSGTSLVLELARVFQSFETEVSIRFVLWNNEETGLNGSAAYVANHKDLQGTPDEPNWIAMIQHDMILFDRFATPDADVEYQASADADGLAIILASFWTGAMDRYGTMPAQVGPNMRNTDSVPFMTETTAISCRENRRDEIGSGANPHWHRPTDRYETYTEEDFTFGFNIVKMTAGALGELTGASASCPEDLDGSGAVDFGDLLAILSSWGPCGPTCPEDLDMSGAVDFGDLLAVLSSWGDC